MPASPLLQDLFNRHEASMMTYGPAEPAETAVQLVETFGEYEAEYAAIRKGVGILHEPQRGLLKLTGGDAKDFLHRMLTQDINALAGGASRRAFQVNNKGRIIADLVVHHGDASTWIDTDAVDLPALAEFYDHHLFAEDVTIEDIASQRTCVALHGPQAIDLLLAVADDEEATQRMFDMTGTHHVLTLAGAKVTAYRFDACAVAGVRLWPTVDHVEKLYDALAAACGGLTPEVDVDAAAATGTGGAKRAIKGRGIGWLAYNTARIEAGTPLFHVDFGPDSLPHETGVVSEAVSFDKGCYVGQEVVARMENLGHPSKILVGLKLADDRQPVGGAHVLEVEDGKAGDVVGAVTSSAVSPMLGGVAAALAMIKWSHHEPGTDLRVPAEGAMVEAKAHVLRFV